MKKLLFLALCFLFTKKVIQTTKKEVTKSEVEQTLDKIKFIVSRYEK